MKRFELQHVKVMPQDLRNGILYVSLEFGTAHHLCACGCGLKVRTPLSPAEWELQETSLGPTLWPSIGNWQLPCKSHYLIKKGEVVWSNQWSDARIAAGRKKEQRKLREYLDSRRPANLTWWRQLLQWMGLAH